MNQIIETGENTQNESVEFFDNHAKFCEKCGIFYEDKCTKCAGDD